MRTATYAAAGSLCLMMAAVPSASAAARDCAAVAAFTWPDTAIDRVEQVPAETVRPFGAGNLPSGAVQDPDVVTYLPAHCLVRGIVGRRPSTIAGNTLGNGFELRMPDDWNGRFFFQGGGGWDGWLRQASGVIVSGTADRASALARGFAVVTTDAGHLSDNLASPATDGRFGADLQARTDNARDAVPLVTQAAKQIVTRYYGAPIRRSYFVGCSNGGREGMLEAQTHPDAFDGVVAGDPAFDLTRAVMAWDWNERALTDIAPRDAQNRPELWKALTDADLTLLTDATARQCASPATGRCGFDPASLQCKPGQTEACLTPAKVSAITRIQRGPSDSAGRPLYSPWTQGGEAGPAGWRAWMLGNDRVTGRARSFVEDWMRYVAIMPGDPPIDWVTFDWDRDPARIAAPTAAWQADGTDYRAFAARGGRILFYHGSTDPAFSTAHFLAYWDRMTAAAGGAPAADRFSRLFLVPGMAHCSGGQAFDRFDPLQAIVDWVEKDQPPARLVATGVSFPGRSMPHCPYPGVPRYDGTGNRDDAASWQCAAP